jgi:hypothetical protein
VNPVFEEIVLLDGIVEPIATRPVDIIDADWLAKLEDPLAQAGIKDEAHSALRTVLELYDSGDATARTEIRALFDRCRYFRWAAHLPLESTPAGFRLRLLHFSVIDQGSDPRDEILHLQDLCTRAHQADVDISPILVEIAALSSDVDKYGMGSTRDFLLRAAG